MKEIAAKLRQKGYRLTKQRRQILAVLDKHPQSVAEVIGLLKNKGTNIDKATVYRSLHCFVDLGVVSKTRFKEKNAKYELFLEANHHHHLVCDSCGSVEDVSLDETSLARKVSKQTNFQIKSHSLEFFGVCADCR